MPIGAFSPAGAPGGGGGSGPGGGEGESGSDRYGLYAHVLEREYRISAIKRSGGPGTGKANSCLYTASIDQRYQYDAQQDSFNGFRLACSVGEGTDDPMPRAYGLLWRFASDYLQATRAGVVTASSSLKVKDIFVWLRTDGRWRVDVGGAEWRVEGDLEVSLPGFTQFGILARNEATIPFFGLTPRLSGVAAILHTDIVYLGQPETPQPPDWIDSAGEIASRARGGWRDKLPSGEITAYPAAALLDASGRTSFGTGLWNAYVDVAATHSQTWSRQADKIGSAFLDLEPGGPRKLIRMDAGDSAGHLDMGFRRRLPGFPRTTGTLVTTSYPGNQTETSGGFVDAPVRALTGGLLDLVQESPEALEEILALPALATYRSTTVETVMTRASTVKTETVDSFGGLMDLTGGTGDVVPPYLRHPDPVVVWKNTWASPFSVLGSYEPADTDSPSVRWPVDGSPADVDVAWSMYCQGWAYHPALAAPRRLRRRFERVTAPLSQNAHRGTYRATVGTPCGLGVCRFEILDAASDGWLSSVTTTTASASRFHFKDGSGLGAGSVVAAGYRLVTGDAIEFDLADPEVFPHLFPTACDRLTLPSLGTNVASLRLVLVGADVFSDDDGVHGPSKSPMGEGAGEHRFPSGKSLGWAVSSTIDGGGLVTADNYFAIAGAPPSPDLSFATFRNPSRAQSPALLPTRTGYRLRIEVDRVDPAQPATVPHATFHRTPGGDLALVRAAARWGDYLASNGPLLGYGRWDYYDYVQGVRLSSPAPTNRLDLRTTVGDGLAWAATTLRAEPAISANFLTRFGTRFVRQGSPLASPGDGVVGEAFEWSGADEGWVDSDDSLTTIAVPLLAGTGANRGIVIAEIDTKREGYGPLSLWPRRERTPESGWREVGEWGQYLYTISQRRRPFVVPGPTPPSLHLGADGPNLLTGAISGAGWSIAYLDIATGGDEGHLYRLRLNGRDWCLLRPFRGVVFVPGYIERELAKFVALSVSRSFAHVLGRAAEDGTLILARADNAAPTAFAAHEYPTSLVPDSLRIDHSRGGEGDPVWLAYSEGGMAKIGRCALGGEPEEVTTLGSGTHAALCWSANNVLHAYRLDEGAVYVRRYDLRGNAIGGESATGISGLDDAPIDCRASVSFGTLVVTLAAIRDGEAVVFRSEGGVSFT